ncbi:MAG: pyruvate synthase subunit beta [Thermoprotei archaeon]|nr:MAG: pyruvate synthase subunit beta [Thermoprotei archaeon]
MRRLTIKDLPEEEYYMPGNILCAGCGESLAMRLALKVLGKNTIVITVPGCASASLMMGACAVPLLVGPFAGGGALAAGVEAALAAKGRLEGVNVVAFIGDGGTADIGFQSLSSMVERGHDVLYICLDNEAYMNTGGQRSGTTPRGAATTTTPVGAALRGKPQHRKNMPLIMADHGAPYVATASIGFPLDYVEKVMKASRMRGPKYIQVLCPCPVGWGFRESDTVKLARLAVDAKVWPLYEVEYGVLKVTYEPRKPKPLKEYIAPQRRFNHFTEEDIKELEKLIEEEWRLLKLREKLTAEKA